jgi:hypothetical protein
MRSVMIGTVMMVAAAGPAVAQGMPAGPGGQPGPGTILLVPAQGGGGMQAQGGGQGGGAEAQSGGQTGGMGQGEGHQTMAERMHHMEWMRQAFGGASFRFRRGQNEIDVHCGTTEPVGACVAAAGALLDKLAAMRGQGDAGQDGSGAAAPGSAPQK